MAADPYAAIAHDPYASIASSAPAPKASILDKAGSAIQHIYQNFQGARTAAARDPVGALYNILGAPEGAVAGAVMAPIAENAGNDIGKTLLAVGHGALSGATDPNQRDKYNAAFGDLMFKGARPQGESIPARVGRGAEDLALQTMIDPVTHGGAAAMGGLIKGGKAVGNAVTKGVKPLGNYVNDVKEAVNSPALKTAANTLAKTARVVTPPVRGVVNAGKDMLFLNPLPHGLGNMTTNNFLKNGVGTAAKGLKYGITGAPKDTVADLNRMGAGAWTPDLLGEPSPWGPVGWMNALGKKGVPAAVRAGVGGTAGGAIGNKTAPDTDTPGQRLSRTAEGAILGALTGASPEVLNASNKVMSRLETGHRAAMLEGLPKPPPVAAAKIKLSPKDFIVDPSSGQVVLKSMLKPHGPAAAAVNEPLADNSIFNRVKAGKMKSGVLGNVDTETGEFAPRTMHQEAPISESKSGRIQNWPTAPGPKAKPPGAPDPRADAINAVFGGLDKSPAAKIATALGGPFAQWQADTVPRVVGNALLKHPARVEALARGQDITNRDVLKDQPYKLQEGGPVGGFSEMLFNTPKYGFRLLGPLGQIDPNQATNPKSFGLGDALKGVAYEAVPGRDVVGPMFGDTMFPSKAPPAANVAAGTALGWHFSNKTPATDAILQIMRSTGLPQQKAVQIYERYKR